MLHIRRFLKSKFLIYYLFYTSPLIQNPVVTSRSAYLGTSHHHNGTPTNPTTTYGDVMSQPNKPVPTNLNPRTTNEGKTPQPNKPVVTNLDPRTTNEGKTPQPNKPVVTNLDPRTTNEGKTPQPNKPVVTNLDPRTTNEGKSLQPNKPSVTNLDPRTTNKGKTPQPNKPVVTNLDPRTTNEGKTPQPNKPVVTKLDPRTTSEGKTLQPNKPVVTNLDPSTTHEGETSQPNKPVVTNLDPRTTNESETPQPIKPSVTHLGFIFDQHAAETQHVFANVMQSRAFLLRHKNYNMMNSQYNLNSLVHVINTADVFKLTRIICNQISRGVIAVVGITPWDSFKTFDSYSRTFNIPFVTPSTSMPLRTTGDNAVAISMKPNYERATIDVLNYFGWGNIIYFYDSDEGLCRLQEIHQSRLPEKQKFIIDHVHRVSNGKDVIDYLVKIEEENRWSKKYVVLDCDTKLATNALKQHVNEVKLGRRNYHYLLTGLAMDDIENTTIKELGVINVTGFGVLDRSNPILQDVLKVAGRKNISAEAALTLDAIEVLINTIMRMNPEVKGFAEASTIRNINKSGKTMDCAPENGIVPFDLGVKFAEQIKKTELIGLTGYVGFTDEGYRKNFSINVMQMDNNGKVQKMGTWQEGKGLTLLNGKPIAKKSFGKINKFKTYVISTIVEYPYLFPEENKDADGAHVLTGFCAELARILMDRLELKYEMRLVKDGKYGNRNPKSIGGWDGMIGELLRHEADLVVAPLFANRDRKTAVLFSEGFLSFLVPETNFDDSLINTIFTFALPFTKELWFSILTAIVGVASALYLISCIENRPRASGTSSDQSTVNTGSDVNEGNGLGRHMWFTITTFFQQGFRPQPKCCAALIIHPVWFFFTLIIFSFYTASLSAYIASLLIGVPLHSHHKILVCPKDDYRVSIEDRGKVDDYWKIITNLFGTQSACQLLLSSTQPGIGEFAIAFPKGSQLRDPVNYVLQELKQEGEIDRLIRNWFINVDVTSDAKIEIKPLTLLQASGVFIVLFLGICLALCIAACTCACNKRKEANVETAIARINESEGQVAVEEIETPSLREADALEEQVNLDRIEEYSGPPISNERPYPAHCQLDESSLIRHQQFARSLNHMALDAGPSTSRVRHRLSNSYELYELRTQY